MGYRNYDLITASIEIDDSMLREKLEELESPDVEGAIVDYLANNGYATNADVESAINDAIGSLDLNALENLPERVDALEDPDTGVQDLQERVEALEGKVDDQFNEDGTSITDLQAQVETLQRDVMALQSALQTAAALTGDRLDRLEATTNTAYSFFALAGKMISLLLNGSRS